MKPGVVDILSVSAGQLTMNVAPAVSEGYAQATTNLIGMMAGFCAQEYERGAEIRKRENDDMRALFAKWGPKVSDGVLKAEAADVAKTADETLAISALDANNYKLRRVLISLQAHFESVDGDTARQARRDIWDVLKRSADARMLVLPGM